MTVSKRILATMSAIGTAATLASCQLPGGSGTKGEDASAPVSMSASKSTQAGGGAHGVVIGSHPTTVDNEPGTVSLNSVFDAGTTITVMFSVTNNDKKNDMWIYDSFSDGDDSVPQPSGKASPEGSTNNADGLTFIESSSSSIYRVSYDSQDGCLRPSDLTEYIRPGQIIALQVTSIGMPAKAKNITTTTPNEGTFSDVAVTR